MVADSKNGETSELFSESDAAWVDAEENLYWLKEGEQFLWLSERNGWRQVFQVTLANGNIHCLTPGNYDVIDIQEVDEKNGWLYFTASPDDPTCKYLYRISLNGGEKQRLSPMEKKGTHAYNISPGANWAVHASSHPTHQTPRP
jgi:dipeptidyl-peptidase-4